MMKNKKPLRQQQWTINSNAARTSSWAPKLTTKPESKSKNAEASHMKIAAGRNYSTTKEGKMGKNTKNYTCSINNETFLTNR